MTRRQIVLYMEKLSEQLNKDTAMQAKLHGFKMKAPVRVQKWSREDDKRISDLAKKRFDQMEAEAEIKGQGN